MLVIYIRMYSRPDLSIWAEAYVMKACNTLLICFETSIFAKLMCRVSLTLDAVQSCPATVYSETIRLALQSAPSCSSSAACHSACPVALLIYTSLRNDSQIYMLLQESVLSSAQHVQCDARPSCREHGCLRDCQKIYRAICNLHRDVVVAILCILLYQLAPTQWEPGLPSFSLMEWYNGCE